MRTWAPPPGMRQAVESPQWNLPFTACTSVSMDTVVVLASSLQAWQNNVDQDTHIYQRALIQGTRQFCASILHPVLCPAAYCRWTGMPAALRLWEVRRDPPLAGDGRHAGLDLAGGWVV